jgi:hypothetical protein
MRWLYRSFAARAVFQAVVRRIIVIAAAFAALFPQAAQAVTLDALKPCYRSVDETTREPVHVVGHDFTPGSQVAVTIDGATTQAFANKDGVVEGDVQAPFQAKGERAFTLTLVEADKPANTVGVTGRVTALAMRLKPAKAKPSKKVRFIGRGFTDGTVVYGHYVRAGKLRKTVALGTPQGPCGTLDVKRRQIPISKPKTGRWTLQVDNQQAYSPQPFGVFVRLSITVRRVLRAQARR